MDDEARGDKSSTSNFPSLALISERTDRVWQTFENSKTPLLAAYTRSSPLLSLLDRRYANGGMNTARAIITGEGISRNENEHIRQFVFEPSIPSFRSLAFLQRLVNFNLNFSNFLSTIVSITYKGEFRNNHVLNRHVFIYLE